jgi:hypothetical protein
MPRARLRRRTASPACFGVLAIWSNIQYNLGDQPAASDDMGVEAGESGTQLRTLFDILATLDMEMVVRLRTKGLVRQD